MLPLLPKIDQSQFRAVLQAVVQYLAGADLTNETVDSLEQTTKLKQPVVVTIFTGIYFLFRAAIHKGTKTGFVKGDLEELRFPKSFIQDFATALDKSRTKFEDVSAAQKVTFPSVEDLQYRVDVIIATNSIARVLKPKIFMELTTSEGQIRQFEMSDDKFHELRFNVAKVLKDMEDIEQLPILKIENK